MVPNFCVSDLLLFGRVTIEEARSLLHWLEREEGFGKICRLSMGGVHAAMVGSLHPTAVATLPFLSPYSAVVAFCEGILMHVTAWEALREDLAAQTAVMILEEVIERMRNVLSFTDVTRFPIPKNPSAVILIAATVSVGLGKSSLASHLFGAILMCRMTDIYQSTQCWSFKRPGLVLKSDG